MGRRDFFAALGALAASQSLVACGVTEQGLRNPCLGPTPAQWSDHALVRAAWEGLDAELVWDAHVHLVGTGDSGSGIVLNPHMTSAAHPIRSLERKVYMNAACAEVRDGVDLAYLARLMALHDDFPAGVRFMLLAFDWFHDDTGRPVAANSTFYTPNAYAWRVAASFPERFQWIASVHPYREDALEELDLVVARGARAIKWLPPAMGIDPAAARCDDFYAALARYDLPLIVHAGEEKAVESEQTQHLGNPLLLRRPLEHGVRVIAAHCASLGSSVDLDKGASAPEVENFDLFARLMDDPAFEGKLFGDLSAMTQANRVGRPLTEVIRRTEWHPRLLNGSDYPLPGVMPLFNLPSFLRLGLVTDDEADVLSAVRRYNPILFDFALKRTLRVGDARLSAVCFETRPFFDASAPAKAATPSRPVEPT